MRDKLLEQFVDRFQVDAETMKSCVTKAVGNAPNWTYAVDVVKLAGIIAEITGKGVTLDQAKQAFAFADQRNRDFRQVGAVNAPLLDGGSYVYYVVAVAE